MSAGNIYTLFNSIVIHKSISSIDYTKCYFSLFCFQISSISWLKLSFLIELGYYIVFKVGVVQTSKI